MASDLQAGVEIADGGVTGSLKFIEGGLDPSGTGPLAGDGWFLALKWSDPGETVTSLKVGLTPTEGTGLVECLEDTDRNGVFKIASTDQFVTIVQTDANGTENWQNFNLKGLTLEAES